MKNKPVYAIESVDNALRLIQMLRDHGALRLKQAAAELHVAPSTAHRLMSMLVYRGFALQDDSRVYHPGPSMGAGPARREWTRTFRELARPHLETLAGQTGETVNLVIRIGSQVRFLTTVESTNVLRVGDRTGTVLPARHTSGGKALLAEMDVVKLHRLYGTGALTESDEPMSEEEFDRLVRELKLVRRRGYAMNNQETEDSVVACAICVRDPAKAAIGAVSVSLPVNRYHPHRLEPMIGRIRAAVLALERDIAELATPLEAGT